MKKLFFTAAVLGLTAASFAQVPNYVPTNGLVGWWPFNGNANDESGNGNNGTVNGATLSTDRFGQPSKAYSFDGVDDYIDILNNSSFDNLNEITISSWIYINAWCSPNVNGVEFFPMIIQYSTSPQPSYGKFGIQLTKSNLNYFYFNSKNYDFSQGNPNFWSSNQWVQIVVTAENGFGNWYVNGINVCNTAGASFGTSLNGLNLMFGRQSPDLNSLFANGKIDDIGIWNRALTACEIADLYNSQLGSLNTSSSQTQTALDSYTWAVNGQTYTQSGTYSDTLVNAEGCDSIVTLYLTLTYTGINELTPNYGKKLVKITDLNGKETPFKRNTILLFIYEDGTVERVYSAD
jgi:hypothetical protein